VFAFGIGTSVNRFCIESMAKAGMGEPFVVTSSNNAESEASRFKEYIASPLLTSIQVKYENFDAYDVEPASIPDVMADRPILIYGKYKGNAGGKIILSGFSGDKKYEKEIDVNPKISTDNPALTYLWARKRIENISDYNPKPEETRSQVIELGLKYNLLTQYTSFIAIDSMVRNKDGKMVPVKQPLPLPQGVSDKAVGEDDEEKSPEGSLPTPLALKAPVVVDEVEAEEAVYVEEKAPVQEESDPVFVSVEETASFNGGGINEFRIWAQQNVIYPPEAAENGLFGKVVVQFCVDRHGKVTDIKVLKGIHPLLDNAVIALLQKSPRWTPAKQGGKTVKQLFVIPIVFNLTDNETNKK
jgi:Ca-activated chloride channel homolog